MKKVILLAAITVVLAACGNKQKIENETGKTGENAEYTQYLETLKADNNLKITMGKVPITIVGKELKVGDKIKEVPLVVNTKLEEKNIFEDKNIKVVYTAPSLDTKVCSLQTKQLNEAAKTHTNVKFYSVTVDTPFAQERFCTANEINGLKAVSDFKYHQFGIQNGFFIKEKGLLTRALMILDENNTVKYIEYVSEEGKEADVEKALKFLENNLIKKQKF
nr:thiol peroxidase [uncultured Leptotrichia sp.]